MGIPTNGKTEIIIKFDDKEQSESPSPAKPKEEGKQEKNPVQPKENNKHSAFAQMAYHTASNLGMQAINASVSQIGLTTGNYYEQARMQRSITVATSMASLAITAMHSPVAAAVALAGMGVSSYFEMKQQTKEREIANYQAAQYAKRIGYSVGRKNQ